jgi:hypothetical protein
LEPHPPQKFEGEVLKWLVSARLISARPVSARPVSVREEGGLAKNMWDLQKI